MLDMLKRHEIQVLRRAGHNTTEVATLAGVSRRSVGRVEADVAVTHVDTAAEIERRRVGRPAKAEPVEHGSCRTHCDRREAGDRLLSQRRADADNTGQGDDDGGPLRQRRHDVCGGEAESAGPNLTPPR